jgi:signal transduction histidine kinase/CheY-like chemotaxis protein
MLSVDLDSGSVLRALLESVPCGVLGFDAHGELMLASAPMAGLLGLSPEQLREFHTFDSLVTALAPRFSDPEALAARWRHHFAIGEASWDELELVSPARKILERFGRPVLDSAGRPQGWLEVYREVTGQRLMEKKLFQNERLVALGQLVSSVAHEINNPLTTIYGYAQLMLRRREGSLGGEPQFILQEAERATDIVRSLLLFARGAKVEQSPVNLNQLIQRTTAMRTYELSLTGIRLHLNLDPNLPPILADPAQVQQVVLNLVNNAEQALESVLEPGCGRGRIWLRTRRLSPERVALDVTDDGPGVAPEIAGHIFDPFFTTKPPGVGTGIGLSIVRGIMHEHGGEVSLQSQPGQGAMFTAEFLVAIAAGVGDSQDAERSLTVFLPTPRRSPAGATHPRRILVVEDEPTVAHLIADVLAEEGYTIETVLDSRVGLDLIRSRRYDLLICDLRMPHLDGSSLYRELLRMESPLAQHLVFVTGDILLPGTIEFLELCRMPCLAKPFRVDELKQMVRAALVGWPVVATAEASKSAG